MGTIGAIAGIAGIFLVIAVAWWFIKKRRERKEKKMLADSQDPSKWDKS